MKSRVQRPTAAPTRNIIHSCVGYTGELCKTGELIEMPFGGGGEVELTHVGTRNHVLDGVKVGPLAAAKGEKMAMQPFNPIIRPLVQQLIQHIK